MCRLFSWGSRLFPTVSNKGPSQKILFIKLIEQGASVLAYSALKQAIERVGKENVYFLVFEENRMILDFMDVLDSQNIIVIRNTGFTTFVMDLLRALRFCRNEKIDSAIDMEFFSRASALIAYLSGAKKRVGLYSFTSEHPYRGNLITHKVHYNPYIHVSKYYQLLVSALDEQASNEPLLKFEVDILDIQQPKLKVDASYVKQLVKLIGEKGRGKRKVILNPNASDMLPLRKWDTSNFLSLGEQILKEFDDVLIVFTGVEKERLAIEQISRQLGDQNCINLAGKTSLNELMALYQEADLIVTNDSGPAHFASLFALNIIVLFGPETPDLFAPLGDNVHVFYKKLACSPCVNVFNHRFSPCTDNICMQHISPEEVFMKTKKLLA